MRDAALEEGFGYWNIYDKILPGRAGGGQVVDAGIAPKELCALAWCIFRLAMKASLAQAKSGLRIRSRYIGKRGFRPLGERLP
jgi:hypothetical protein